MDFFWLFAAFIFVLCGVVALALYLEKRHVAAIRAIAQELGFQYVGSVDQAQPQNAFPLSIWQFALFSKGSRRHFRHVIQRNCGIATVFVGEYFYSTGTRKRRRSHLQTVVVVSSPKLRLPEFSLVPEKLFHKVGRLFSYQDINFASHPDFSRKYLLRGTNETDVQSCFHEGVLEFFQRQPLVSVEGADSVFVYYRDDAVVQPRDWYQVIDSALEAYEQFYHACG
ncbi:MAG: hypothetical protein AAFY72_08440 [Cyanobacteria bacterium J06649_4]